MSFPHGMSNDGNKLDLRLSVTKVDDERGILDVKTTATTNVIPVAIASGATGLSGAVELTSQLVAIEMPAEWTAANLTFQAASTLAGTYKNVYDDDGLEVTVTAAAARIIPIDTNALKLAPLRFIKIRSGTAAVPVDQTTARALNLIGKA